MVAADLTIHSLRVLLEDSLPLCKQNGYKSVITCPELNLWSKCVHVHIYTHVYIVYVYTCMYIVQVYTCMLFREYYVCQLQLLLVG